MLEYTLQKQEKSCENRVMSKNKMRGVVVVIVVVVVVIVVVVVVRRSRRSKNQIPILF